jgi:hypothetical protein
MYAPNDMCSGGTGVLRAAGIGEDTDDEAPTRRNLGRQHNRHECRAPCTRTDQCSDRHSFLSAVELLQHGGATMRLTTTRSLNHGTS